MRAALVTNPRAGRGRGLRAAAQAEAVLRGADWQIESRLTEGPGDGIRLARQAAHDGYDAVLACGGDGTLSEVLNGLRDTGIPAGVIPVGTGNDFCRTVGISRDPAQAARQLLTAEVAAVDMLAVNDGAGWAVNVIGVGFDARVARRINRRRRLTAGLSAYLTAVTQELIVYRPNSLTVEVDGTRWEGAALLVAIANARSYGAGMCIAPMAEIDDGLLDVIVVAHLGRLAFLRSFPLVLRGAHLSHPAVRAWRGREVKVTAPTGPVPVLVDGEVRCETPLSVRVVPGAARMLLPKEWKQTRRTACDTRSSS